MSLFAFKARSQDVTRSACSVRLSAEPKQGRSLSVALKSEVRFNDTPLRGQLTRKLASKEFPVRIGRVVCIFIIGALAAAMPCRAQSPVATIKLGKDLIGLVKTAQGLSTRISFPEPVKEIICGDLYDPASGRGSFVLQRGENDVFVKPITPKGISNLFVKTGDRAEHTYNFDLVIVPTNEALRVVNVIGERTQSGARPGYSQAESDALARKQVDETVRQAEAEAANIIANAQRNADTLIGEATERAQKDVDRRFVNALMLGLREEKTGASRVAAPNGVTVTLDQRVIIFGDRSYLRYTIHNNGAKDFTFDKLLLEDGSGKPVSADIIQAKTANVVKPGESLVGIIVFTSDSTGKRDRLTLSVRGEGSTEIARLAVTL